MVAGTSITRSAPSVEFTISPIVRNSIFATPCTPAKLTITNETAAIKKVLTFLGETFTNPTISPIITSTPNIIGCREPKLRIPTASDSTTPIKKAHAPKRFSRERIAMILYKLQEDYLYKSYQANLKHLIVRIIQNRKIYKAV